MPLKNIFKSHSDKKPNSDLVPNNQTQGIMTSDDFPIVRAGEMDMNRYQRIPIAGLAALGSSFAQLPASARTIVQTVKTTIETNETLFIGVNPKNVEGYLRMNQYGTVGNIMQVNEQGKNIIAGRMRFKPVGNIAPAAQTTTTMIPIDPTSMMVAAALVHIEQKLDDLQKTAEDILQFLTIDKQAKQRGNLNMLGEIFEEYKQDSSNEKRCELRSVAVQTIKKEALQDILFYQEQISRKMKKQQLIHGLQQAKSMLANTMKGFQEYKLACYLYSFASFLDVLLRKDFSAQMLGNVKRKMTEVADRYAQLYTDCHAQLAKYQRTSVETQILGGIGSAAKSVGKALGSVPVLNKGSFNEALVNAGDALDGHSRDMLMRALSEFETMEDTGIHTFMENIETVNLMHNAPNGLLTDGDNLYLLQPA